MVICPDLKRECIRKKCASFSESCKQFVRKDGTKEVDPSGDRCLKYNVWLNK